MSRDPSPKLLRLRSLTSVALLCAGCSSDAAPESSVPGSGGAVSPSAGGANTAGQTSIGVGGVSEQTLGGSAGAASSGDGGIAGSATAGAGGSAVSGASSAGSSGMSNAGASGMSGASAGGSSGASGGETPIKVWMAGDSTMQNCSSACPCGWGSQFAPLFNANVTVVNSAVGGRSIQSWLYEASVGSLGANGECSLTSQNYDKRWTAMLDATTGMKPGDYLFIQFGINDTDAACPKHVGTALFKTYLTTMAQAAKARGAQPIFVTPVSAIICSGNTAQPTRGRFVTATVEAAMAASVPLLDLHQLSIDRYNQLGFCPNDENYDAGKVGDFFCKDHTHFEAAGAKQIAGLVAGALATTAPPLAKYVK